MPAPASAADTIRIPEDSRLMRYLNSFLAIDAQDRMALEFVERQAAALKNRYPEIQGGTYEDMLAIDRYRIKPGFEFIDDVVEDRKALADVFTALDIVKFVKSKRQALTHDLANDYVQSLLTQMGLDARYNTRMNPPEIAGKFAAWNDGQMDVSPSLQSGTLFFDGIDQDVMKTSKPILSHLQSLGLQGATFAYEDHVPDMALNVGAILSGRDTCRPAHQKLAEKLIETPGDAGSNIIAYSNGCLFWKGVQNAMVHALSEKGPDGYKLSKDEIRDTLKRKRALTIGTQPLWGVGLRSDTSKRNVFEYETTPEITLYSPADMFGPTSMYLRSIMRGMLLKDGKEKFDKDFLVFEDPNDPNKVAVFIHPDALAASYQAGGKAMSNMGGHSYQCYMASVGLMEGTKAPKPEGEKVGALIKDFLSRQMDLSKGTVADAFRQQGFEVLKLDKGRYRMLYEDGKSEKGDLAWEAAMARQLAKEYLVRGAHPLLALSKNNHKAR